MTQGEPLAMIAYDIRILPLIKKVKRYIPDITQPWYDDDAGYIVTFAIIQTYFNLLTHQGLWQRYYPEPSKSVLIVHPENLEAGKVFGAHHGFKVCKGARYLGGYIGDNKSKRNWLRERTLMWKNNIGTIREKYPQESYYTVACTIQPERIFLQRITWYTGVHLREWRRCFGKKFCLVFSSERQKPSHPL